jgi:hypothetical protein
MLPPLPRRSGWRTASLINPSRISLPRKGRRVGLRIVLFEACSAFTHVAACTLALSPIRDTLSEGFSHFVTSMTAPVASGWSGCRVGLAPTGKRRLSTAHTLSGHREDFVGRFGGRFRCPCTSILRASGRSQVVRASPNAGRAAGKRVDCGQSPPLDDEVRTEADNDLG